MRALYRLFYIHPRIIRNRSVHVYTSFPNCTIMLFIHDPLMQLSEFKVIDVTLAFVYNLHVSDQKKLVCIRNSWNRRLSYVRTIFNFQFLFSLSF